MEFMEYNFTNYAFHMEAQGGKKIKVLHLKEGFLSYYVESHTEWSM